MKKSEIFNTLLDKVSEVCEVKRSSIINGSKLQAVVDARVLAVQYLRRIGLSSDDIALIILRENQQDNTFCPALPDLKKKAKSVDKMFNSYSSRCLESYAFCLMSAEIKQFCRDKYKELYLSWMKELPPIK